jgi:L-2-hydroxyglutarate oxidase
MQYDITIVGAGIVGLATAYKILERKPDIRLLILEKESGVAMHQTGNNSGVIHTGIYYRPGSLRALKDLRKNHRRHR